MELDQLKHIWQRESIVPKREEQIISLMCQRSQNPIARIRRNLMLEAIAMVLIYGAVISYYFLAFHGKMSEVSWFLLAIIFFFFGYYFAKTRLLKKMECITCQVRTNLQRQVTTLEKYVQVYLMAGTAIVPISLLFFGWLIYIKLPPKPGWILLPSAAHPWWHTLIAWLVVLGIVTVLVYFLNRWYVRKLYGTHIQKLKQLVAEMQEDHS